ncbi:MAG: hypothetical protein P8Y77_10295, partial [Nitrospirota bacterium]
EAIGITTQLGFFEDPNKISLREMIKQHCEEIYPDKIEYSELEAWAYAYTNGISKTIKEALMKLEEDKCIKIKRKERQRKNTVTTGAMIQYRKNQ